jgi:hypothetical protein
VFGNHGHVIDGEISSKNWRRIFDKCDSLRPGDDQTWLDGLTTPQWVADYSFFFFCSLLIENAVSVSPKIITISKLNKLTT